MPRKHPLRVQYYYDMINCLARAEWQYGAFWVLSGKIFEETPFISPRKVMRSPSAPAGMNPGFYPMKQMEFLTRDPNKADWNSKIRFHSISYPCLLSATRSCHIQIHQVCCSREYTHRSWPLTSQQENLCPAPKKGVWPTGLWKHLAVQMQWSHVFLCFI